MALGSLLGAGPSSLHVHPSKGSSTWLAPWTPHSLLPGLGSSHSCSWGHGHLQASPGGAAHSAPQAQTGCSGPRLRPHWTPSPSTGGFSHHTVLALGKLRREGSRGGPLHPRTPGAAQGPSLCRLWASAAPAAEDGPARGGLGRCAPSPVRRTEGPCAARPRSTRTPVAATATAASATCLSPKRSCSGTRRAAGRSGLVRAVGGTRSCLPSSPSWGGGTIPGQERRPAAVCPQGRGQGAAGIKADAQCPS